MNKTKNLLKKTEIIAGLLVIIRPIQKKELVKFIHKNGYKVFEISSSYGLCGWVVAKDMQVFIAKV